MRGRILGFNAADGVGAITAEDGARHRFAEGDWRGDQPPTVGSVIDFDLLNGNVRDIYPVMSDNPLSGLTAPKLDEIAGSPPVAQAKRLLTTTLAFPLALIVILAFFLPAIAFPQKSLDQFGAGRLADTFANALRLTDIDGEITAVDQQLSQQTEELARLESGEFQSNLLFGSTYDQTYVAGLQERQADLQEQRAALVESRSKIGFMALTTGAFWLRFVAVIGALGLAWLAWTGRAVSVAAMATGGAALVAAALAFTLRSNLAEAFEMQLSSAGSGSLNALLLELSGPAYAQSGSLAAVASVGLGTWTLIAVGLALVASGLGLIRNPLAKR